MDLNPQLKYMCVAHIPFIRVAFLVHGVSERLWG